MKLNLYILVHELSTLRFAVNLADAPTVFNCAYPLPYRRNMPIDEGPVYIIEADMLSDIKPSRFHDAPLICLGKPPNAYLNPNANLVYTDDDISVDELLARLLRIFNRYAEWGQTLQEIIDENGSLKSMGDVSQPLFGNPIYLQEAGFRIIFHVIGHLREECPEEYRRYNDIYDENIPLQGGSFLSAERINALISDQEFLDAMEPTDPTLFTGANYGFRYLTTNIRVNGHFVARFLTEEVQHEIGPKDYALSALFAGYLEKAMRHMSVKVFDRPKDLDDTLAGLLAHRYLVEQRILSTLSNLHWDVDDPYLCMVMESKSNDQRKETLEALALNLIQQLPSECYTVFQGKLVYIFNLRQIGLTREKVLEHILPVLRDNLLVAGISTTFGDFKELYYFYHQALSAWKAGSRRDPTVWYYRYEDYNLDNLLDRCLGEQITQTFISPELDALIAYDADHGTELIAFLRLYLDCSMGISETARRSFVNRSTCVYRLNRIAEISHLQLDDPDVRLELELVLRLYGMR